MRFAGFFEKLRSENLAQDFHAFIAFLKNRIHFFALVGGELQFTGQAAQHQGSKTKRFFWHRGSRGYVFYNQPASQHARGVDDQSRQDDFPNAHQPMLLSASTAEATMKRSRSCERSLEA